MATRTTRLDRARRATERQQHLLGSEFLERRLALSLSHGVVATAAGIGRNRYARIERGNEDTATLGDLNRLAAILGLEISIRAYPGGPGLRDAGQARRLATFLALAAEPLYYRVEVALPATADRRELRAWDAMLYGHGERTAIELEMRVRDAQEVRRRHDLKRRDDPTEQFLMLVADTRHNRRILAEFAELFADLPRLRPRVVRAALQAGRHPPPGLLLV